MRQNRLLSLFESERPPVERSARIERFIAFLQGEMARAFLRALGKKEFEKCYRRLHGVFTSTPKEQHVRCKRIASKLNVFASVAQNYQGSSLFLSERRAASTECVAAALTEYFTEIVLQQFNPSLVRSGYTPIVTAVSHRVTDITADDDAAQFVKSFHEQWHIGDLNLEEVRKRAETLLAYADRDAHQIP